MSESTTTVPAGQPQPDYSTWTTNSLIERITELERQLHSRTVEYTTSSSSSSKTENESTTSNQLQPEVSSSASSNKITGKKGDPNDITHTTASRPPKAPKKMDPSKYTTRFIALKFAYLGQRYNGLEHANGNITPLPTIEEEIWKALRKLRLIFPTDMLDHDYKETEGPREMKPYLISWEGCDYSKAGRTDRGVSAFGQVIGIRVRSARPKGKTVQDPDTTMGDADGAHSEDRTADETWDDIADELPYISMLNRALPEDIRVVAWCPHPPEGFDARFSCRERQYKYFFTQPAFSPTPGPLGFAQRANNGKDSITPKYREGWLDIEAMREAAKYFEGVHDFRNFCKVDTSKQIENFERIIYRADIELLDPKSNPLGYVNQPEFQASGHPIADVASDDSQNVSPNGSQVYVFTLQGSAFLWHQVRHMVGMLFLVGQGLETPSIVRDLLDVFQNPRKPMYEMASDAPLVLWDCIFPDLNGISREDALEWIYAGDSRQIKTQFGKGGGKFGIGGVVEDLWAVWRQRKMDEILAGALLDLVIQQGDQNVAKGGDVKSIEAERKKRGQKIFVGSNEAKVGGKYVPVMQKRKIESVEVLNARWLAAKQRRKEKESQASNGDI
ncbi:hypothetical protein P175DRAFT_0435755 [Aspergillus ochraceoroseus IBT 24754]|uniref:Pseudouridine synthase I TruA alpha/beta domain-containing protein n=1 Tax=Aspergillus ochraceoroseus IBT 24754 TaxID=1392256 RepID=A0A2T5LYY5_9EURO|nr:uncharacterized protein P175DRAFT_0435755 [Aspergillus ochraceoroseus IBT 24754]PTU21482.1 hypothetical protein P175DRAFT_0435755 [Aspergillus ochraceoroseus IBT 24754]